MKTSYVIDVAFEVETDGRQPTNNEAIVALAKRLAYLIEQGDDGANDLQEAFGIVDAVELE